MAIAQRKANREGGNAFFPEVFRVAGELIAQDTDGFCDRVLARGALAITGGSDLCSTLRQRTSTTLAS